MKELKTKEEFEDASMTLIGCVLVIIPFAMLVASIAVGFIFGAGFGFLAFFCLLAVCIWFICAAKFNMCKAKKAAEKEQGDD